jgi:hypothetical protein
MPRVSPTIIAASLLALTAGPAAAADKPTLSARVTACTTGVADTDRAAAFTGAMPSATGARAMQMRFVLLQRRGSTGPFKALVVPDWGAWETSDPGRSGFVFTQRIDALLAPAGYKAAIYFRWLDKRGRVLRMARRTTGACEQPDLRPDLSFAALAAVPAKDGATYTVAVANDGRSKAAPFAVTLAFDGAVQGTVTLGPVDGGARVQGTIAAPACTPGSMVTLAVDAGGAVDEVDERGNVVTRPCPLK